MTVSGPASQPTQMPFVLYIDNRGSLANHAGVHTLNCGEKTHYENVLASASSATSTELCPRCGESTHFTGKPLMCPNCAGNDAQCPLCGGRGDQACVYIMSIPQPSVDPVSNMTRESFQANVEEVWEDVLTHFDVLVNAAQGLAIYLFTRMDRQNDKHEVLARMAGRACQTTDAINCLLHAGHPDAAFAQSRMLQEIEFNMMAIHNDASSDVAVKYREWGFGKYFRDVTSLRKLGIHEMDESEYKKMEAEYQEMCNKHGPSFRQNDGWIGTNVFERAKNVNQEVDYRKFYTAASSFVHTDSRALFLPMGLSERNRGGILVGPSGIGLDLAAMRSAVSLVHIMIQLPDMLEVEEDEQTGAAFEVIVNSTEGMVRAVEAMDHRNLRATLPSQAE